MPNTTDLLFKTVRADSDDFWNDFIRSLIDPKNPKYRGELRSGSRKNFTYRICKSEGGLHFEIVVTDKKDPSRKSVWNQYIDIDDSDDNSFKISIKGGNDGMSLPEKEWVISKTKGQSDQDFEKAKQEKIQEALKWIKNQFTKHQSTSLCVIDGYTGEYTFKSPAFGHNAARADLLVGVMLKADLCHIQRVMKYDAGTVSRSYDQGSKDAQQKFLDSKKDIHYPSLEAMVRSFNSEVKPDKHTEIMAGLRCVPNSQGQDIEHNINDFAIAVFSNNLESRLLAQLRHRGAVALAKEKDPDLDSSQIPIVIYGEDSLKDYSPEAQQADLELKDSDSDSDSDSGDYQHYIDAIKYIETGCTKDLSKNFLSDDFIGLVAGADRDKLSKLFSENLIAASDAITSVDTFFIVMKNLDAEDQQENLLEQIKDRLLDLDESSKKDPILHIASSNDHLKVVNALLAAGADKDAKENKGWTALMIASYYGHLDVVRTLLDKGADKEVKNNDGSTALMLASYYGHLDVVKALLAAGADKDAKDKNNGATALIIASENSHLKVVAALSKAGLCSYLCSVVSGACVAAAKVSPWHGGDIESNSDIEFTSPN